MATMATQYADYPVIPARRLYSWSGIFAGTFVYLAIEATFGLLGAAIFSTASNPSVGVPTSPSMSTGFQVWMVVLSIIALYFAGKTSSKLLARDGNLGLYHGLVTFGMAIFSTILIIALSVAGTTTVATTRIGNVAGYVSAGGEWWLFVAFVLSMIAAAAGGMHGSLGVATTTTPAQERTTTTRNVA
jgi:hypothetical protein